MATTGQPTYSRLVDAYGHPVSQVLQPDGTYRLQAIAQPLTRYEAGVSPALPVAWAAQEQLLVQILAVLTEIHAALETMGRFTSRQDLNAMVAKADKDHDFSL